MAIKKTLTIAALMSKLEVVKTEIEDMYNTRQDRYDQRSEKWQDSDAGQEEIGNVNDLEELAGMLEEAYDKMDEIFED